MNEPRNNKVILTGQVREEPVYNELLTGHKVIRFTLSTNDKATKFNGEEIVDTQHHTVVLWGKLSADYKDSIKKGDSITIVGRIQYRSYRNSNKQTVYLTEIVAHSLTRK